MREWYTIKAAAGESTDPVEVYIFDVIGDWGWGDGVSAKGFINDIQKHRGKKLNVLINSPGGAVTDGLAIYNYIRQRGNVDTHVIGIAASIASVIALGGETVSIAENGLFMVHNPSGISFGTSEDMRKDADVLDVFKGSLQRTYQAETGATEKQISDWMDAETWFSAEDAKAAGFVDNISAPVAFAAHADLSRFKHPTARAKTTYFPPPPTLSAPKTTTMSALSKLFGGPSARETFLASALAALGVTDEQLTAAEKDNKPDFVEKALSERVTALTKDRDDAVKALGEAKTKITELEAKVKGEEKKAADAEASSSKKAQDMLGNMGTPPVDGGKGDAKAQGDKEFVAQYKAMKDGRAKTEFFNKHKERITRLSKSGFQDN